ncbi:Protein kinase domain [Carpediemonas membranifera]|uniref:Protein kinase domain n=1 Tax=Carpediemonas membranifera TaxID=201153 RepID=A0A8J6B7T9_9EUKA|nr:Protein kinase domain [Carpediemonas membranifera]|eukprot:KAG9394532.1 Protein kinase domain [Carpediemonas membranifera]
MESVPQTIKPLLQTPVTGIRLLIISYQLFSALAHLHCQGTVHRDVKPDNILFNKDTNAVYLTDFGHATHAGRASPVQLIPRYRAPELLAGSTRYTAAADIWAVGVLLVELCRGGYLFPDCPDPALQLLNVAALFAPSGKLVVNDTVIPCLPAIAIEDLIPDCPVALARILGRCLKWHERSRPTAAEIIKMPSWKGLKAMALAQAMPCPRWVP